VPHVLVILRAKCDISLGKSAAVRLRRGSDSAGACVVDLSTLLRERGRAMGEEGKAGRGSEKRTRTDPSFSICLLTSFMVEKCWRKAEGGGRAMIESKLPSRAVFELLCWVQLLRTPRSTCRRQEGTRGLASWMCCLKAEQYLEGGEQREQRAE
jgi:hypothetical protein